MRNIVKLKNYLQFWANLLNHTYYISTDGENYHGWSSQIKDAILIVKPNKQ